MAKKQFNVIIDEIISNKKDKVAIGHVKFKDKMSLSFKFMNSKLHLSEQSEAILFCKPNGLQRRIIYAIESKSKASFNEKKK